MNTPPACMTNAVIMMADCAKATQPGMANVDNNGRSKPAVHKQQARTQTEYLRRSADLSGLSRLEVVDVLKQSVIVDQAWICNQTCSHTAHDVLTEDEHK